MIDLHVHLLPGLDDGPAELAEAVEMCRLAAAEGIKIAVATPHQLHEEWENTDAALIRRLCAEVEGAAQGVVHLVPGAEIRVCSELVSWLERRDFTGVLTLADSRYVLIEPSPYPFAPNLEALVYELRVAKWWPILAHPERYGYLASDPRKLEALVARGAYVQLSAASVIGFNGRTAQEAASYLLDRRFAHFLASDGHDCHVRPPRLAKAKALVTVRWGEALAEALTETNPRAVLEDRPLEWEDPT